MLMSGFAGHIDSWLAIARHEKIDQLEKSNGYNSCNAQLCKEAISRYKVCVPLVHYAKIGCFIFVCLFSIFGIVFILTELGGDFFLASDSEPEFYANVRLRRTH